MSISKAKTGQYTYFHFQETMSVPILCQYTEVDLHILNKNLIESIKKE